MVITSKRGSQDNVLTYEHICDESADLNKIDPHYITLGSVAIILQGQTGLEIYMANSKKEWISLGGASNKDEASSPQADQGQADSMVLGE